MIIAPKHFGVGRMVLVTTVQFGKRIEIGDPVSQAKIYQAQAADELIFVDLDSDKHDPEDVMKVLKKAAEEIFMPFTVGGGVKTLDHFKLLLTNGADKISINSSAVENSDFISLASARYGASTVVVSIDYKKDGDGKSYVWINNGKVNTGLEVVSWALEAANRGAGEILLTSIDRDGTRSGLDIDTTRAVSEAVTIPVITSGGCGFTNHFIEGFKDGKAEAVSAGTYFCFKDENPMQTRSHIKNAGVPIRTHT